MSHQRFNYIGLMSGTSLDGIDVVIAQFGHNQPFRLEAAKTFDLPDGLKQQLLCLTQQRHTAGELDLYAELDVRLGHLFADVCLLLLHETGIHINDIIAIGSHGQTVRHYPDSDYPTTLQIGDPNIIAQKTGITTVADFRRRDMAAGGQGAPLVPPFHQYLFSDPEKNRVVLNIGGIANITYLPANNQHVIGFDTGPGNGLLDDWCLHHLNCGFDKDGILASQGQVKDSFLQLMLADPYFNLSTPKSTGREYFSYDWIVRKLEQFKEPLSALDVLASLAQLTAHSIALHIKQLGPRVDEVLICGGGINNAYLLECLKAQLVNTLIASTETYQLHPDWVEAAAFAWLAQQTLHGLSGNLPEVTGAREAVILGGIWPGKGFFVDKKDS